MRTFTKKCDLEKHKKICFPLDDYGGGICEICSETFEFQIDLERHRKNFTNLDGSFKYVCGYCEAQNCSIEMLRSHMKSESEVCHEKMRHRKTVMPEKVFP